jgi:GH24 family phage-related lysozyme (muramidase)
MSNPGIDALVKKFEGCRLKSYRCPANVLTIGFGHTSAAGTPEVPEGLTITQQEAEEILRRDLRKYETGVEALVKVDLNQHQFDTLVDFAYNAGLGNLKTSTLLRKVNARDFDAVPSELMKWTKGGGKTLPGLVKRRQAEVEWWNAGDDHVADVQEHRAEPDPILVRKMAGSKQGNAAAITVGLGSLGAAKEIAAQAQEASDTADQLMALLGNTNFVIMAAMVGLGAAIWYWRKQHMETHGV